MKKNYLVSVGLLTVLSWSLPALAVEVTFHIREKQVTRGADRAFQNVPLSGWCTIRDKAGREYLPVNAAMPGEDSKEYFYFWENFVVDLKLGVPYTLRIQKGFGWQPFEDTITLEKDQTEATIFLSSWINPGNRRWLAGDLDTRFRFMDPSLAMDSQGVSLVCRVTPEASATLEIEKRAKGFNHLPHERAFTGRDWGFENFNVLGTLAELVVEDETSFENTDVYHIQKGKTAGGFVDAISPEAPEVPIAAALGLVDYARVVGPEKSPDEIWDETRVLSRFDAYYDLLNAGFHIPVSAGSLASETEPLPDDRIGSSRVYARVIGAFSLGRFLDLLKQGASWATNGPMVSLMVNKKDTGREFEITPARKSLSVSMGARSAERLDRIELIHNGEVVETLVGSATQDFSLKDFRYEVDEPGWIAARAFEQPREGEKGIRYAHSSPVYFTMGERPDYRKETVQKFAGEISDLIAEVEAEESIAGPEKVEMLKYYRNALDHYEGKLKKLAEYAESGGGL